MKCMSQCIRIKSLKTRWVWIWATLGIETMGGSDKLIWSCWYPKLFGIKTLTDWLDLNKDSQKLKLWGYSCLIQTHQKCLLRYLSVAHVYPYLVSGIFSPFYKHIWGINFI